MMYKMPSDNMEVTESLIKKATNYLLKLKKF